MRYNRSSSIVSLDCLTMKQLEQRLYYFIYSFSLEVLCKFAVNKNSNFNTYPQNYMFSRWKTVLLISQKLLHFKQNYMKGSFNHDHLYTICEKLYFPLFNIVHTINALKINTSNFFFFLIRRINSFFFSFSSLSGVWQMQKVNIIRLCRTKLKHTRCLPNIKDNGHYW